MKLQLINTRGEPWQREEGAERYLDGEEDGALMGSLDHRQLFAHSPFQIFKIHNYNNKKSIRAQSAQNLAVMIE